VSVGDLNDINPMGRNPNVDLIEPKLQGFFDCAHTVSIRLSLFDIYADAD
jgi:hypothetical protein